ncbi:hypothetical protein BDZ89DRAFT_893356, partial [Hymenopellis radicata]
LPLVIGMPVVITANHDVSHGVVNGTSGFLRKIRYRVDGQGRRQCLSCVVEVPGMDGPPLTGLKNGHAAVLRDTVELRFTHK